MVQETGVQSQVESYLRKMFDVINIVANCPGDHVSILGQVIPKTHKMVLDTVLLNIQYYKVRIKGKVEQSREWGTAYPYTTV